MRSEQKPNPRRLAQETLERLRARANEKRAASHQRFFKEPVVMFGIEHQEGQATLRDLYGRVKKRWTVDDAVRFCDAMVRDPHLEARGVGYQLVARFAGEADPGLLRHVRRWLERRCGNWALVDTLAPHVLGPLIDRHRTLAAEVITWTDSPNLWVRRGAMVAYVPLVKQSRHLAAAYRTATRLLGDDEDLMHKAVGWVLREAGKTDTPRLESYLLKHGPKIPRTTVRYAIERFPEKKRKALLVQTRG